MSRRAMIWAVAALLGIVLTAAITWATSRLTSQHIGLSSEPLSAGRSLAPAMPRRLATTTTTTERTTTTTVTRTRARTTNRAGGPVSVTSTLVFTRTTAQPVEAPSGERDDGHQGSGGGSQGGQRSEGRHPDD